MASTDASTEKWACDGRVFEKSEANSAPLRLSGSGSTNSAGWGAWFETVEVIDKNARIRPETDSYARKWGGSTASTSNVIHAFVNRL